MQQARKSNENSCSERREVRLQQLAAPGYIYEVRDLMTLAYLAGLNDVSNGNSNGNLFDVEELLRFSEQAKKYFPLIEKAHPYLEQTINQNNKEKPIGEIDYHTTVA